MDTGSKSTASRRTDVDSLAVGRNGRLQEPAPRAIDDGVLRTRDRPQCGLLRQEGVPTGGSNTCDAMYGDWTVAAGCRDSGKVPLVTRR